MKNALILSALLTLGPVCFAQLGNNGYPLQKTECPRHQEDNPLERESLERGTYQCTSRVVD